MTCLVRFFSLDQNGRLTNQHNYKSCWEVKNGFLHKETRRGFSKAKNNSKSTKLSTNTSLSSKIATKNHSDISWWSREWPDKYFGNITLVLLLDLQANHSCFNHTISGDWGETNIYTTIATSMMEKEGKDGCLLFTWFSLLFPQPEFRVQEKINAFADKVMWEEHHAHPPTTHLNLTES